ncbi:MAG TPA: NAD-dependent epimerase/dehydratase family protein [Anaerolineales bacterium]|nr:NAD-dependent epimerase/dehydratase family protein [Anaerolineales bacterium]
MNILITGNLSSLTVTLVKELAKRKNRIVLASEAADKLGIASDDTVVHSIDPAGDTFRDVMSSYGFDIAVFISTREEQLYPQSDLNTGHQLDGLRNTLELCKYENLKHFFYISSTEVYGDMGDVSEQATPQPASANGHTLLAGEQYCRIYHDKFGVNVSIMRLTNIYGPDEESGLLYGLITACQQQREVSLPARENCEINLLHVRDVADFLIRAIDEEYTPEALVVNLAAAKPIAYSELARLLQHYYPAVTFHFPEEGELYTKTAKVSSAKRIYDWIDEHRFSDELKSVVESVHEERLPERSLPKVIGKNLFHYPGILKWIELTLGAVLTQFLSEMTGTLIQFKYVDFRLLFVVIMGSIYGLRTGLYAAILVSISILYTWIQLGFDWALLVYNVGNWFPFALYFTAGLITGYNHDRSENQILNAQKQVSLIYEKYSFLYGVFNDIRNLKDEFRERLLGYRDSFGKIFTITRELDQLQEQAIYLRALSILEEHMDNKNIAIYSLDWNRAFARLEANSASLNEEISKSLRLSDFPELLCHIEQGTIFQNTALLPNYPAYMVPIFNNTYPFNVPAAMIVIWSVKFEQYSTYYYNLLKVICGLIQASLIRATLFSNANYERMYLPTTRILNHEAFREAFSIRVEMKKNRISDFQLIVLDNLDHNIQNVYPCISEEIRDDDIIGMGNDGNYYILLSQADKLTAQDVVARLTRIGIQSRLVDANQVLLN